MREEKEYWSLLLPPPQPEAAPELSLDSPGTHQACELGQVTRPLSELQ